MAGCYSPILWPPPYCSQHSQLYSASKPHSGDLRFFSPSARLDFWQCGGKKSVSGLGWGGAAIQGRLPYLRSQMQYARASEKGDELPRSKLRGIRREMLRVAQHDRSACAARRQANVILRLKAEESFSKDAASCGELTRRD